MDRVLWLFVINIGTYIVSNFVVVLSYNNLYQYRNNIVAKVFYYLFTT